jgi:chromate transporter
VPTAILAVATLLLVWRYKQLPEPLIVFGAALVGVVLFTVVK